METISPVRTSSTRPAAAIALYLSRADQFVAHRVLHAQIDRELDRLLLAVAAKPGEVQVGKPAVCRATSRCRRCPDCRY